MMKTQLLQLKPVVLLLAAAFVTGLGGCDMGTYGERVEQAGAKQAQPVSEKPAEPDTVEKDVDE